MFDEAIWASMNSWLTPTYLFLFLNLMIGTIFITSSFNSPKSQQQQPSSQITRAPSSVIQRLKSVNIYSYQFSDPKPEFELERIPSPVEDQVQTQIQTQTRTWAVEEKQPLQITRAPSVLQRLKSINLYCYPFSEPKPELEPKELSAKVSQVSAQVQTRIQTHTKTKNRATRAPAIVEDVVDDDEGPTLDEIYSRIKGIAPTHNRHNSDTVPVNGDIPVKLPAKIKKSASHKSAFNHFHEANDAAATVKEEDIAAVGAAIAATSGGGGAEVDARADDFINRFKKQLHLQRIESIVRYKD